MTLTTADDGTRPGLDPLATSHEEHEEKRRAEENRWALVMTFEWPESADGRAAAPVFSQSILRFLRFPS
jgi:hypothetical protein